MEEVETTVDGASSSDVAGPQPPAASPPQLQPVPETDLLGADIDTHSLGGSTIGSVVFVHPLPDTTSQVIDA